MSDGATVWLAVMATALAVMAAIQIAFIVIALRVGREMGRAVADVRREIHPLVEKIHRIADDAARATSLAAMQVERVDQLLATTCRRLDEAAGVVQAAIGGPLRQASAAVMAFRAAFSIFRSWQRRGQTKREDEDALFVG